MEEIMEAVREYEKYITKANKIKRIFNLYVELLN